MQDHSIIPVGFCQCGCGQKTRISPKNDGYHGWIKGQARRFAPGHNARISFRSLADRFWAKVNKNGPIPQHCPELGPCWIWMGAKAYHGYGQIGVYDSRGKMVTKRAHRVSWEMFNDPIPDGLDVCHHCDNPPCIRPNHLFVGTVIDNLADASCKGRMASGERHSSRTHPERVPHGSTKRGTKLNEIQVAEIRHRYAVGDGSYNTLGREYGVHGVTVFSVVKRRTWKHVL